MLYLLNFTNNDLEKGVFRDTDYTNYKIGHHQLQNTALIDPYILYTSSGLKSPLVVSYENQKCIFEFDINNNKLLLHYGDNNINHKIFIINLN